MLFFAFYLIMPLLPIYLRDVYCADKQMIGIALSGYTLFALFIRPFSGYVVDSYSRKKVLMWCWFFFSTMFAGYFITGSLIIFAMIRTLHGAPFGATTVANSTMMIDVLPSTRRTEGIGYYGLSNNLAMAIGPTVGLLLYSQLHNFDILFGSSLVVALGGFALVGTIDSKSRAPVKGKRVVSLDRFFLLKGVPEGILIAALSFGFGVISTYLAIYSHDVMHLSGGTGGWFAILSAGLMLSRVIGGKSLREGKIVRNAGLGMSLSVFGYLLFVALPNEVGYFGAALIIGLGNGHMFPAVQNMFINLATNDRRGTANSSLLTMWDVGVGSGVVVGGAVSEHFGYSAAFWTAFVVNALGVLYFWLRVRSHFLKNRLTQIIH